jgi:hypothetical protein
MNWIKFLFCTSGSTPTNGSFPKLLRPDVAEADADIKRRLAGTVPKQLTVSTEATNHNPKHDRGIAISRFTGCSVHPTLTRRVVIQPLISGPILSGQRHVVPDAQASRDALTEILSVKSALSVVKNRIAFLPQRTQMNHMNQKQGCSVKNNDR